MRDSQFAPKGGVAASHERTGSHCTVREQADQLGLAGKTFIITGGGSGIGLSTARALACLGCVVVAVDIDRALTRALPPPILPVCGDISLPEVAEEAMSVAVQASGQLHGAVFAAGSSATGSIASVRPADFERDVMCNLTVHLTLSQAVLRYKASRPQDGQCSMVYIASKQAVAPSSGFGGYPVAKGAMLQLARLVALEGGGIGVRANTVNPGAVFDGSRFWSERLLNEKADDHNISADELPKYYADRTLLGVRVMPEDVANAVLFLLSPLSRAITGTVLGVDGGLAVSFGR
jgi:NAD(P)-dependent dehydrogenase (short-subunit alcohol dehydrogenase family)